MEKHTLEEYHTIAKNMTLYGGSFVKCLGEALRCADINNRNRLADAFPEYFEKYLNF